jgi:RNA polymerase sigma-70 factor (ECF subfamily)
LRNRCRPAAQTGYFSDTLTSALATYPAIDWIDDERSWSVLVAQIAQGNQDALTKLYDSTNRIVYGLALRILGDSPSAEEILFEVYLQVWRTANKFDPNRGKVTSWLVSMTRSRAIDALRARQARGVSLAQSLDEISDVQDPRSGPEGHSVQRSRAQVIRKFLAELPGDQRNAIELAYFSGLTHGEIAARTGLPLGTVKTRIRSGIVRLRELLAPYQERL